jgi:hypothetical protein
MTLKFNPLSEVEYRARLAERYLADAEGAFERGDLRGTVASPQLAAENAANSVVAVYRVPSWSHDPSHELREAVAQMLPSLKPLAEELASVAELLAPEHARADTAAAKLLTPKLKKRSRCTLITVLVDEVFLAIGFDKAETYVKSLLNLIEYPPASYESIVVIAATSEGATREKIGRHLWALPRPMWNMSREGFERLYKQLPDPKPDLEEARRMTGGNPRALSLLHQAGWSAERAVADLAEAKGLAPSFVEKWRRWLEETVEDPDTLWRADTPEELIRELVARNLIVYNVYDREPWLWIDQPPSEKDLELGIGRRVAWQSPLHREAVKRALKELA